MPPIPHLQSSMLTITPKFFHLVMMSQTVASARNILFTPWAISQVSAALRGMAAAGIREGEVPVCGLAKREEEVHVPGQSGPLVTDPDQNGMLLLRAARDESHRFALRSHRRKRSSNIYAS
jgi:excinuclease ABC subunit C